MLIIPAIDLKDGACVRLRQGRMDEATVFGNDPLAMATRWVEEGARRLHLVDLNGAFAGEPVNAAAVRAITRAFPELPVQIGGGIRTFETAEAYLDAGLARVILGSVAVEDPALLERLATAHPGRIVLGLDARDGRVATRGWIDTSPLLAVDVARRHADLPLAAIVYTDIATDGTLAGPNVAALEEMLAAATAPVIASGGIATLDDIRRVAAIGCAGCIVGRALYDDACTRPDALIAAGE